VLFTHLHADHTHGIDDLRAITARRDAHLPMYGSAETLAGLAQKFDYIFDDRILAAPGSSKPQGRPIALSPGVSVRIADVEVTPVTLPHGPVTVYGYRIGPLAYVTDAQSMPDAAIDVLRGARVLVINALFHRPHPSHLSVAEAISAARRIGAERTYLTHLTHESFHAALEAELPAGIAPAYDGLSIQV
jgi:phosphoribosyl 1,2-cyclic phosphate phosphodiesterase